MGKESSQAADSKNPLAKDKPKGSNKLMQDIEKARNLNDNLLDNDPLSKGKKATLEPLKNQPKSKLEPLDNKPKLKEEDDFDFLGLDDVKDSKKKEEPKKAKDQIEDNYDFDFDFDDTQAKQEGGKAPAVGSAPKGKDDKPKTEDAKKKDEEKPTDKSGNKDEEEDEYIYIDGKRFREIQIEGEEDEFLMDDDGNIYDKEGQYIGTAKDGEEGEGEGEEEDK